MKVCIFVRYAVVMGMDGGLDVGTGVIGHSGGGV